MTIFNNTISMIGNTPMVRLKDTNIYVKLEGNNPGGSVKDRAVLGMIEGMESRGELKAGDTLIEATSGNTGIAVSMLGSLKGYNVIIIMPDTMSKERQDIIKAYGASLILTPGASGMQGSIDKMEELLKNNPSYKPLGQFDNGDNLQIHYRTTGREIYNDLNDIDIFVTSIGSGGTLSGVARYLKEKRADIMTVGVEPEESPLITKGAAGPHKIQGIGANFVPKNLHREFVDEFMTVSYTEAVEALKETSISDGLLLGISSGANIAAAKKLSEKYPDKKIVTISPDNISKYMSLGLI